MADILVVDDEPNIRVLIRMALENAGHAVEEAASGFEALATVSRARPDVVLVDIVMPDMDGIETIRRLRAEAPALRIVALSGGGNHGFTDYLKYARLLGADDAIQKPVSLKEVVARIGALLAADRA
jgi:DNA-binding response OmpR family regulator